MRTFLAFLFCTATINAVEPATWHQWRGPTRDGIVTGTWPDDLKGLKQLWQVNKLGPSYSGPIVAIDRVFTTQTVDKKTEIVSAYDRTTGKELWSQNWAGSLSVPFFAARNGSWIRSTPAYDGKTLFVAGIRDVLVAFDGATGKEQWRLDFVKELGSPLPDFGCASSPLVDDTGVYLQGGGQFVKVDKTTGKILWKALNDKGGMMGSAFSSPIFAKLAGQDQIVVQTRTKLAGVSRENGKELWSKEIPSFRGMNILTPLALDDSIFTSTYGGNTRLVNVASAGGKLAIDDAWTLKYEGNMTSPVAIDGHAYLLGKDRRFVCVNLKNGKDTWRSETRFGEYWSLVACGDKLLALDARGTLYLLKANPKEFTLLDQKKIAESETWAHLAVCGEEICVRDLNGLTMWQWK